MASRMAPRYGLGMTSNPGAHWEDAGSDGWSADLLAQARACSERAGSTAVMIVQHGRVVAQWGDTAHKSPIASVRKSLASALYGIAVEERKIRLDATLAELGIDDKQPLTAAEKLATVADLLMTCSGVYHPADSEPAALAGPRPARGSHQPGVHFYYNNWDFNVLGTIYERQTGEGIYDAFKRRIADPIGLEDFAISDCAWGPGKISDHRNYGFTMSARDLARFGTLYARAGAWNDRQIVPAPWVDASTRTHVGVQVPAFPGQGYGHMWWTRFGGGFAPGMTAPEAMFFAFGLGAQYIFVLPTHDLVIVHTVDMAPATWPDIGNRQIARLLWLILSAAGIKDIGTEPSDHDTMQAALERE
jgi:CubicO group peptidase (beta-lactamase class C family)